MTIDDNATTPWFKDRTVWLMAVVVLVAVLAVFGRCSTFPFSSWDDPIYVRDNAVLDEVSGENLRRIFTPGKGGIAREMIYVPLSYLSWLAESAAFGKNPKAMHVGNVLLHLANTLLVMGFLLMTFRNRIGALFGALLFAIHPLQVEAVAGIMGRKDLLATLFSMLSIVCYAKSLSSENANWRYVSVILFALAVFAKPSVITLPAVFVILDYRKHGTWLGGEWGKKLPYVAIIIVALMLHAQMPVETFPRELPPYWFRVLCIPYVLWHVTAKLVLPTNLLPIYPWPSVDHAGTLAALGALAVVIIIVTLVVGKMRRIDPLWQGVLVTGALLVPALKVVVDYREFITADRYVYLPMLGLAMALNPLFSVRGPALRVVSGIAAVIVVGFAVQAFRTTAVWSTTTGVSDRVLAHYPEHVTTRLNRAIAKAEANDPTAEEDFLTTLRYAPNLREARMNYAIFLKHKLRGNPNDYQSAMRMAILAASGGDVASAEAWFRRAAEIAPTEPRPHRFLARFLVEQGRLDDAKAELEKALEHHPNDIELKRLAEGLAKSEEAPAP